MENDWWKEFKKLEKKFLMSNYKLSESELEKIFIKMSDIKNKISQYQENLLRIGKIIDYNEFRKNGASLKTIQKFNQEDSLTIFEAKKYLNEQITKERDYMFGYPSNMINESSMIKYLRWIESQLFYINSCGTAYEKGNYRICQKENELRIISKISENLKLNKDEYWGYITTGGTEGNLCGIREGLNTFKKGIIYFSDNTHYSVYKFVELIDKNNFKVIPSQMGAIDKEKLMNIIKNNPNSKNNGVILLMNYGTTTIGGIDDIEYIVNELKKDDIPYYIHIDAALYGGIPNKQFYSPTKKLCDIMKLNIDSISISLHKYLGLPRTNGILLSKTQNCSRYIDYIGQLDKTICGSRDFLPYTTLQRIKEMYDREPDNSYYSNISFFENEMKKKNIYYKKGDEKGNIFLIKKPSNEICKKYQLSTFTIDNEDFAHIIIFPFHRKEVLKELAKELAKN